jgi:hypothetical protein
MITARLALRFIPNESRNATKFIYFKLFLPKRKYNRLERLDRPPNFSKFSNLFFGMRKEREGVPRITRTCKPARNFLPRLQTNQNRYLHNFRNQRNIAWGLQSRDQGNEALLCSETRRNSYHAARSDHEPFAGYYPPQFLW